MTLQKARKILKKNSDQDCPTFAQAMEVIARDGEHEEKEIAKYWLGM